MSLNNRIFTEEDKKRRPKLYIQEEDPELNEDYLLFQVTSENEEEGQVYQSVDVKYKKDNKVKNILFKADSSSITLDDGKTIKEKFDELTPNVIYETLLSTNWIVNVNTGIPYSMRFNYSIPKEYDIFIILNSSDKDIIEQCIKANIISGEHEDNYIVIHARGEKPTLNLPIKFVIIKREPEEDEEEYILEPATKDTIGGIKSGDGFSVEEAELTANDIKNSLDRLNQITI